MKILQINSASGFGGGERHFLDLISGLQTRRHEIFAAVRAKAVWRGKLTADEVLELPLRNAFDVYSSWRLARLIREKNIEIVHAHLARDYFVAALACRLSRTNARLFLTRHVLFPVNKFYQFALPPNAKFIAVSKAVANSLLNQKIVAPEQVKLIYNGVDTRRFAAVKINRAEVVAQQRLSQDKRFVGIVGEITAHKGQLDFVRAAAQIAAEFADVDFLIVGQDGSPDRKHEKELRRSINEFGLNSRVHLVGFVADIAPLLKLLEVFVSASRVEPFGLVIIEAMSADLPVVATKSEGASEILSANKTAKLVKIADSAAMATAISEFLNDKKMRDDFGKEAQIAALEKFDLARMIDQTERLYQDSDDKFEV